MNEYDDLIAQNQQAETAKSARLGFSVASATDADGYAEAQRVARRTGVPVDTVLAMPKEMKQQDRMAALDFDAMAKTSPATAAILADVERAKIAHDDVENLTGIESVFQFAKNSGNALRSGIYSMNAGIVGVAQAPVDLVAPLLDPLAGRLLPENPLRRVSAGLAEYRQGIDATAQGYMPRGDGNIEQGWYSGLASLSRNLTTMPIAFLPGGQPAALAGMTLPVFGDEFGKARDKGLGPVNAATYGASQAAIEYATEKLPLSRLVGDVKAGEAFFKLLGRQAAAEVPGEQVATILQDLNEWAVLNPEKPFSAYLAERPDAAAQTLVATLVGVGGQTTVVKGIDSAIALVEGRKQRAEMSEQGTQLIEGLNKLAAANKVLARDPETFQQFVAQAAEGGPVQQVFIDANTLMQSGVAEQIAAVSPAVAEQLQVAVATGGQIAIPVDEYAARIAPTEYAQSLVDHLKTEADGFSRAEAQEYMQSGAAQELEAEAQRIIAEKEGDDTFKASAEVVRADIKQQLDMAARFTPQVNDAYSAMVGNFYAVQAARLGMTPEELFKRYPLKVQAESVAGGQQFEQGATLDDVRGEWEAAGIKHAISERDGLITVSQIVVPEGERGSGKGTAAMQALIDYADRTGQHIALSPSADFGGNKKRLVEFYKRFGFVENKGKNRAFTTSESMYRQAAGKVLHQSAISRSASTFDEARVAAKAFQGKPLTNAATDLVAIVSRNNLDKMLSAKAVGKSETAATHSLAVANLDVLFNNAILGWSKPDAGGDKNIKAIHRFFTAMPTEGGPRLVKLTVKEFVSEVDGNRIYSVEAVELNEKSPAAQWVAASAESDGIDLTSTRSVGDVLNIAQAVEDGNKRYNQSAFHGSPHKFSKFSLDHIGTGEGAQAFGWGLYFAGNREVAEWYRDNLSSRQGADVSSQLFAGKTPMEWYQHWSDKADRAKDPTEFYDRMSLLENFELTWNAQSALNTAKDEELSPVAIKWFEDTIAKNFERPGATYEVEIPEDDTMLLWDKPLSEQPEKVREAVESLIFEYEDLGLGTDLRQSLRDNESGESFYRLLTRVAGSDKNASRDLNRNGAFGIKYLDGTSRTGGDGSFNYVIFDDAAVEVLNTYYQDKAGNRGSFNPATLSITLLKNADLSTFLHESGHFFLEVQADIAGNLQKDAEVFGRDTLKPGERQILDDTDALLRWFGVQNLAEWYGLDFEEKRSYHEQFARGFESYLFEGKAPSIELQGLFQRFRAWLVSVYRELKNLNVELTDEVRGVFDRMLATNEQITLAEQGRSMMPLFTSPEQAGMTPEEFAAYQALGVDATNEAIQDMQARGLRDMQWIHNTRGRIIKKLQRDAKEQRAAVEMDVRREVMSQPLYRAWRFLTAKMTADDKVETPKPVSSSPPAVLDETMDSLFVAIAKLGGLNKDEVVGAWGVDPADKPQSGVFGKPLWRIEGGLSIDAMAEALGQYGYLQKDENGKVDVAELERLFDSELRGSPVYSSAYAPEQFFTGKPGEQLENIDGLTAGRLHLDSLAEIGLPVEIINHLKALRMTAKDGLHPDVVADLFGFTSGDELVRKLAAANTPKEEISALTDVRMLEQYGDLSSPEAIERAADKAIHNETRARMVATEANALAKAAGQRKTLTTAAKEFAAAMVARLKVRNVKPGQYANAEVRAAKAAEKASRDGDIATAAAEKRNQLINTYATRAAHDALDDVDAGLRYLKRFDGKVKGLDADYLDQIDALLERFDLRKGQSLKAIDKRKSFAAWLTAQREAGLEPDIPESLENDAYRISYKDMSVEEFRGLLDTIKQIEHLGRLKNKLLTARDERELAAIVAEAEVSIRENGGKERPVELETPRGFKPWLEGIAAGHRKLASLLRQMDGGKDNGPMWRALGRGMNDAGTAEAVMIEDATKRLAEIFKPILAMKGGTTGGKQFIPAINASLTRGGRLAVALNWGNETNRQRIMDGDRWSPAQANAVLSTLTREEWTFVQNAWDFIDSYWPDIAAKEKRVTGRAPDKVQAAPFSVTLADGTVVNLRGGYYPIKYDSNRDDKAEKHDAAAAASDMMRGAFTRSTTRRGHTKERVESVKRPVKKTLDVITQHVSEVAHDLAWHEWLIDANRLIDEPKINQAVRDHYGTEVIRTIKDTLQGIATADIVPQTKMDQALLYLRANVSRATMGLSLTTAFLQPFGLTQSMVRIGPKYVLRGLARWGGDIARFQNAMTWIGDKSDFMRLRNKTFNRELHEIKGRVVQGRSQARQIYDASLFMLMQKMQLIADVPTWIGAYEKALAENHDDATAVAMADQAVLDSQGGGQTKDMSELQRKHPMLTMFYSYFSVTLNLAAESTAKTDFKNPLAVAGWLSDMALLMVIPALGPALILHLLKGGGDEDDDLETWLKRMAEWQAGYLLGTVIGARELSGTVAGFDYTGPPAGRIITELGRLSKQAQQGELDEGLAMSAVQVMGAAVGIPSVQIVRSWRGWNAWAEDDAPATSILLGPPPKD